LAIKKKAVRKRGATNYLSNANLLEQIKISKTAWAEAKAGVNDPDLMPTAASCMSSELVKMLMMLVNRYAQRANWRNYTYLDDMMSEATISLLNGALKFNPEVSQNPFGYLTQIVTHSFLTTLDKEKKVRRIRDDILEQNGLTPSHTRQLENDSATMLRQLLNESYHMGGERQAIAALMSYGKKEEQAIELVKEFIDEQTKNALLDEEIEVLMYD
jgi:DNA-directed RNA polymerase specialized sigma subunit